MHTRPDAIEISVIIPTHNRINLLIDCLDSIFAQVYDRKKYEIIIVDDGSSDRTKEILTNVKTDMHLGYFYQENKGQSAARNTGAKHAQGDILAFIDDDCIADGSWLENISSFFNNYTGAAACGYDYLEPLLSPITNKTKAKKDTIKILSLKDLEHFLPAGNFAIKKQAFQEIGGFDESFPIGEDIDINLRLLKEKLPVYSNSSLIITHRKVERICELFRRTYRYGLYSAALQKKHCLNLLSIHFAAIDKLFLFNFPFNVYFAVNKTKIIPFLIILSVYYGKLIFTILLLIIFYITYSSLRLSSPRKGITYMLRKTTEDMGWLFGSIAGSIKYKTIFIR
jgi:glycosyltransferase involved in cell wall biosynthesis